MDETSAMVETIAQEIRDFAFARLRGEFPFLKLNALESMVEALAEDMRKGMREQQPIIASSKAHFDFFKIPPELRNRIYEDVLVDSTPKSRWFHKQPAIVVRRLDTEWHGDRTGNLFAWPALLAVNKQIRKEALPVFLGQNTFVAPLQAMMGDVPKSHDDSIFKWLNMLGPDRTKMIKRLVLNFRADRYQELMYLIRAGSKSNRRTTAKKQEVLEALCVRDFGVPEQAFTVHFGYKTIGILELLDDGSTRLVRKARKMKGAIYTSSDIDYDSEETEASDYGEEDDEAVMDDYGAYV